MSRFQYALFLMSANDKHTPQVPLVHINLLSLKLGVSGLHKEGCCEPELQVWLLDALEN